MKIPFSPPDISEQEIELASELEDAINRAAQTSKGE